MRPEVLSGTTFRLRTEAGTLYVTVNTDEKGKIVEVFIQLGKAGSTTNALTEALGRVISVALQHGTPVEIILKQLQHIRAGDPVKQKNGKITDAGPDAVALALETVLGIDREELLASAPLP